MKLFKNDTVKVERDNGTLSGKPIFIIWELIDNAWHFWGKLVEINYNSAFNEYENKRRNESEYDENLYLQ